MSCARLSFKTKLNQNQLTITAKNDSDKGIYDIVITPSSAVFEIGIDGNETDFSIVGTCEGSGKRIKSTYHFTWDDVDTLQSIYVKENINCCKAKYSCFDNMVGISKRRDCECIDYPPDGHISHSGYYLESLLSFTQQFFSSDCGGTLMSEIEEARQTALAEIEGAVAECLANNGIVEDFEFSQILGLQDCTKYLNIKDENIRLYIGAKTRKAAACIDISEIYFLPFYVKDKNRYVKKDVTIDVLIRKNGLPHEQIETDMLVLANAVSNSLELSNPITLDLQKGEYVEIIVSLKAVDTDGNCVDVLPSNNIAFKGCCGAKKPDWLRMVDIRLVSGDDMDNCDNWQCGICSGYMGGIYIDASGSCSFIDLVCDKVANKKSMLYKIIAEAFQKKWAAEVIHKSLLANATNPCFLLNVESRIDVAMSYNARYNELIGYRNDKGQYVPGTMCTALMNSGFDGTCYSCKRTTRMSVGRK